MPDAWIERLFGRMEALYGARFQDQWRHADLLEVKRVWAAKLGRCDRDAVTWAVEACDALKYPPTLPEFLDLCRQAPRQFTAAALPEPKCDQETARRHLEAMNAVIGRKVVT